MNITLKNIGIINDSTIKLDGLTVITGKNNSGKTTVGKAVYSLLDAVSNIRQKAYGDKYLYLINQLENAISALEGFRYLGFVYSRKEKNKELVDKYAWLFDLVNEHHSYDGSLSDLEKYVKKILNELYNLDTSKLSINNEDDFLFKSIYFKDEESVIDSLNHQREKAIDILERAFEDIAQDPELIDFARESINQTLNVEFVNQIQPVKCPDCQSYIELFDNSSTFFKMSIQNNKIVNDRSPVFFSSPYQKVHFVDDPFIFDDEQGRFSRIRKSRSFMIDAKSRFLDLARILPHREKLKYVLKQKIKPTVFEQTVLNNSFEMALNNLSTVLPGSFDFSSDGDFYVHNGTKLHISNLATGSKMFSIIKILIEKGEVDNSTSLILDEPEAHLHPMWQNQFAELIVLLVKYVGVNILLTTHSPNFMLALDAYMRKYDLSEITNFYKTVSRDDGFVDYVCLNDDMGEIYGDFLQYLSQMKILRNKYLENVEE